MHKFTKLSLAAMLGAVTLTATAVPAKRDPQVMTQPDGTTVTVQRQGDERGHFLLSTDGLVLTTDLDGTICYARLLTSGRLESTGVKALDPAMRVNALPQGVMRFDSTQAIEQMQRMQRTSPLPQNGMGCFTNDFPRTGEINGLIILVEYSDVKFSDDFASDEVAAQYFKDFVSKEGFSEYGATGCVNQWFRDQSNDQFRPHFDVYGPVTLPNPRSYYGGNYGGSDRQPHLMIVDGCKILDETTDIDFSKYDNDGDGVVDNVFCFYAGQGEASYGPAESVWPHNAELTSFNASFSLDGVRINRYATTNAWGKDIPDGIGTFIHEFSHVMGLPDLYSTSGVPAFWTPDMYSIMDYGPYNNNSRTPCGYSIFERNALGWTVPTLISKAYNGRLEDFGTTNAGYIIQTENSNEFFLFENRQQTGWDRYIPGHGMIIWHIDFDQKVFDANTVNNNVAHCYVDLIEANNNPLSRVPDEKNEYYVIDMEALQGWVWPGLTGATEFTPSTKPSFTSWGMRAVNLPITNIAEDEDGVITFLVDGGDDGITLDVPQTSAPTAQDITADSFTATWQPVAGATDYELTVYGLGIGEGGEATANMGTSRSYLKLPKDWTSTTTDIYTSEGYYGQAVPALKLSQEAANLTSPVFGGNVSAISYWRRGEAATGSWLTVQGLVDDEWQDIYTDMLEGDGQTITVDPETIPMGTVQVRFLFHKNRGTVALDDVAITYEPGNRIVEPYNALSTQGATTYQVTGLPTTHTQYAYTVRATDGKHYSDPSPLQSVQLSSVISLDAAADSHVEYYDILGRRVLRPQSGSLLIERRAGQPARTVRIP